MYWFAPQHLEEHHERWNARLLLLGRVACVAFGVFVLMRLPVHLVGSDEWVPFSTWLSGHRANTTEFIDLLPGQRVLVVLLDVIAGVAFVASGSRELPLWIGLCGWLGAWVGYLVIGVMILGSFGI